MTTELQSLSAGEKQQEEKIDLKKKVVQLKIATEEYNHLLKSVNVVRNRNVNLSLELMKVGKASSFKVFLIYLRCYCYSKNILFRTRTWTSD